MDSLDRFDQHRTSQQQRQQPCLVDRLASVDNNVVYVFVDEFHMSRYPMLDCPKRIVDMVQCYMIVVRLDVEQQHRALHSLDHVDRIQLTNMSLNEFGYHCHRWLSSLTMHQRTSCKRLNKQYRRYILRMSLELALVDFDRMT